MKSLIFLTALSIVGSCANKSNKEKIQDIKDGIVVAAPDKALQYGKTITADELELHATVFSSARFEGRAVGTKGQKLAAEYLEHKDAAARRGEYKSMNFWKFEPYWKGRVEYFWNFVYLFFFQK